MNKNQVMIAVYPETRDKIKEILSRRSVDNRRIWRSADDLIYALLNESKLVN